MAGAANAGEVRARLVLDNSQFRQGVQQARSDMQGLGQGANTTAQGMSQLATASAVVGTTMVAAIGASVGAAANFEQGMARVKAISNATDSEFAALSPTAKDLGASTQFSATQAAEGLSFLSMAGFKAQDSIDALPAVLNLAAAGQLDLGRSADIVSNIMTGFGISATDTGHAVDVLTKTMTSANTDLPMLGDAMKYVAPVAASLGISMEDTATAVAKMSDAGIQGSMAGTALRAALLQLNSPVGAAEKEFEKLGLSVKDASGNMLPLPQIIGRVNEKMQGMTESQKTAAAAHLVGTEAASGFVALLKVGEQGLADYSKGLENSAGTAERVAKIQQDTLKGAWDELTSAAEGLAIGIGEKMLPAFTEVTKGATSFVNVLAGLDPQLVSAGLAAAATAAGVALLATGIAKAVSAVRIFTAALMTNPATMWITGVSVALGLLAGAFIGTREEAEQFQEVTFDNYKAMDDQSKGLTQAADDYDKLRGSIKLNNDELLEYQRLQKDLESTTDPRTKQELQAALDGLVQKSRANNEAIQKTINLSDELIKQAPSTDQAFDSRGNAIAKTTDAARLYVEELNKAKAAELELQKANAMKNLHRDAEKYQKAVQSANDTIDQTYVLVGNVEEKEAALAKTKKAYDEDLKSSVGWKREAAQEAISKAEQAVETAKKEVEANKAKVTQKRAEVTIADQALQKNKQALDQVLVGQMAQAGINYEKGKEIEAIDQTIAKEQEKINKLNEIKQANRTLTTEQQNQLAAAEANVQKYGEVKTAVQDTKSAQEEVKKTVDATTEAAGNLNKVYSEEINKPINADTTEGEAKVSFLDRLAELEETKKVNADTSAADGKIDNTNAKAEEGKTKPLDLNPTVANAKINDTNLKAQEKKVKPIDGNPTQANAKIQEVNKGVEAPKTKPILGNPIDVNAKIQEANKKAEEKKIKPVGADVSKGMADIQKMQGEAEKPASKQVKVWYSGIIEAFGGDPVYKKHNGGTTQALRPKFHNGGSPAINHQPNRAKFDEVDVRLLKNEMVLTGAQQENLFNMIRTFNAGMALNLTKAAESAGQGATGGDTHINVAELHVREEADIQKVAEQLKRLERQRQRARGI
ncbi:phage tail tape measure protein [Bacillus thuringiensis]|uniref:phage tail tape measure protein n=1 Tax=Bacillus thuringiensis TaxID=1428 RepID=UPI001112AAB9|nr:phage tail tape measure protein [Bacillus thuringiensis]QCY64989.1 phage tail tape measure protein [Bacillus thuringiensis]